MLGVKNKILFEHSKISIPSRKAEASLFCLAKQSVMGDGVGSRLDFFVSFFGNEKKKKAD